MAKSTENTGAAGDPASEATETPDELGRQSVPPQPMRADDSKVVTSYANFCGVAGTAEEMIVDFGLNRPSGGAAPVVINQRVIMSYYTAKRLVATMAAYLRQYEAAFGILELDVQKRQQGGAGQTPSSSP